MAETNKTIQIGDPHSSGDAYQIVLRAEGSYTHVGCGGQGSCACHMLIGDSNDTGRLQSVQDLRPDPQNGSRQFGSVKIFTQTAWPDIARDKFVVFANGLDNPTMTPTGVLANQTLLSLQNLETEGAFLQGHDSTCIVHGKTTVGGRTQLAIRSMLLSVDGVEANGGLTMSRYSHIESQATVSYKLDCALNGTVKAKVLKGDDTRFSDKDHAYGRSRLVIDQYARVQVEQLFAEELSLKPGLDVDHFVENIRRVLAISNPTASSFEGTQSPITEALGELGFKHVGRPAPLTRVQHREFLNLVEGFNTADENQRPRNQKLG